MDDWWDYDSYDYQDVSTPDYGGDSYDYGGSEQAGWQGGADYAGGGSYDGGFDTGYDGGWSPTADTGDAGYTDQAASTDAGDTGYDAGYTYDSYDYQAPSQPDPGSAAPAQEYDSYDYQGSAAAPTTQTTGLRVPDQVRLASSAAAAPAATSQSAVTGAMGGKLPTTGDFARQDRGQQPALASDTGSGNVLKDGYNAARRFANENKELTSLGIKAIGALAGGRSSSPTQVQGTSARAAPAAQLERAATNNARNDAIAQQVAERATTNNARNDAITQQRETLATQAVADVNNIDPQRYGIDAMNKTQARGSAAAQRGAAQMRARGQSQATIDAENRRAALGNTRAGYQSYAQGYDQGATQRRAGLRDASSMYPTYGGTAYQPYGGMDTSAFNAGQALNQQQDARRSNRTAGLVSLFEDTLGNPTRRTREQEYLA